MEFSGPLAIGQTKIPRSNTQPLRTLYFATRPGFFLSVANCEKKFQVLAVKIYGHLIQPFYLFLGWDSCTGFHLHLSNHSNPFFCSTSFSIIVYAAERNRHKPWFSSFLGTGGCNHFSKVPLRWHILWWVMQAFWMSG